MTRWGTAGPPPITPDIHAWHEQLNGLRIFESKTVPEGQAYFTLGADDEGPAGAAYVVHPHTLDAIKSDGDHIIQLDLALERILANGREMERWALSKLSFRTSGEQHELFEAYVGRPVYGSRLTDDGERLWGTSLHERGISIDLGAGHVERFDEPWHWEYPTNQVSRSAFRRLLSWVHGKLGR